MQGVAYQSYGEGMDLGKILSFASGAEELFLQSEVAEIHSIYKNTMNIRVHKCIFAIQPFDAWFTPMTIRVDRMPDIGKGDLVTFDRFGIMMGEERYDKEIAERCSCKIKTGVRSRRKLCHLLNLIKDRLSRTSEGIAPGIVWTGLGGDVSKKAYDICLKVKWFLASGRLGEAAGEMSSMIGLGPGLTPSGDDFLVGFMAALGMNGEQEFLSLLCGEIERNLMKTNDISAAYLSHACQGEFSEPFHCLFSTEETVAAVNQVASVGHSSGTDALAGIYFGLEQFGVGG